MRRAYGINNEYLKKITQLGTLSQAGYNPKFSHIVDLDKIRDTHTYASTLPTSLTPMERTDVFSLKKPIDRPLISQPVDREAKIRLNDYVWDKEATNSKIVSGVGET